MLKKNPMISTEEKKVTISQNCVIDDSLHIPENLFFFHPKHCQNVANLGQNLKKMCTLKNC
jgi:hypothetical protein